MLKPNKALDKILPVLELPAIWDHTVFYLPRDTGERNPALTPASKLVSDLARDGRLSWPPRLPGRESNPRSFDHESDALTTTPPSHSTTRIGFTRTWSRDTHSVKVAGAFALQEVFEASHRHVERVDNVEAQMRRRIYYITVVLD